MSTAALTLPQTAPASTVSSYEIMRNNLSKPGNWTYLIPTIGVIALGAIYVPNFALGLAAGAALCAANVVVLNILKALGVLKGAPHSEYAKQIHDFPALGTLIAPILEEGVLRGAIQPLATRAILWLVPAAAAAFMGTGLSIAFTVSIVATSMIFGAIHLPNSHKNAYVQALVATVAGIPLGLLAAQFGLGAAIAAHIINNTILVTGFMLGYQEPALPETTAATTAMTRV